MEPVVSEVKAMLDELAKVAQDRRYNLLARSEATEAIAHAHRLCAQVLISAGIYL